MNTPWRARRPRRAGSSVLGLSAADASSARPGAPAAARSAGRFAALSDARSQLRFWSVALAGLALDLWAKQWAFHALGQGGRRVLIPYVLELQTMLNDGALFGIGSGRTGLFLLASLLALGLVLWMFAHSSPRRWAFQVALGAILAGALGNMYDRIFVKLVARPVATPTRAVYMQKVGQENGRVRLAEYPADAGGLTTFVTHAPPEVGFVRDFIKIPTTVGSRELWPWVFNLADVLLVCGVSTLALYLWRDRRARRCRPALPVDSSAGGP